MVRRRVRWIATGLLLFGSTTLAATLTEIEVRIVRPQSALIQSPGMYEPALEIGYRMTPGQRGRLGNAVEYDTQILIDDDGTRIAHSDPPTGAGVADGGTGILFIGDSFTFGQGVEAQEAYPALVATMATSPPAHLRSFNGGVPGYGTAQAVGWLARYGAGLEAQVVVLGIFLGNDVQDNARPPEERFQIRGAGGVGQTGWYRPLTDFLYAHSHLYRLARVAAGAMRGPRTVNGVPESVGLALGRFRPTGASDRPAALAATSASMRRYRKVADSLGMRPFAVLAPENLQVDPAVQETLRAELGGPPPSDFDLRYPNRLFASMLRSQDIPFLDLTGPFEDATREGATLYLPIDGHWNADGHRLAARLIMAFLRESGVR